MKSAPTRPPGQWPENPHPHLTLLLILASPFLMFGIPVGVFLLLAK